MRSVRRRVPRGVEAVRRGSSGSVDREGYVREVLANAVPNFVEDALALAEAVKHRVPVSVLPPETLEERRKQNERESASSW